jgi:hypothetical protein
METFHMPPEYLTTGEFARYVEQVDRRHATMDGKLDEVISMLREERVAYEHRMTHVEQRVRQERTSSTKAASMIATGVASSVAVIAEILHRVFTR